ncbi:ATP-binding cassette domain-containing protein [Conexibacter stalactiti]|uniref:ATP-binding cassette domain-containing protein n=1 Tax=Conexibacter stalactiti TaxID=1940611 RepID=A0ABU4HUN2_9ACTN|nr:ATP-binding cassette domain-containing protein [Conexibacter stalactiti]MDW5597042.1 ATP-binding cassette domain-containing protein [Conexibacter stalactiti]MEC5037684.1 ATP-binding cassette domain-containing protein [Conexibacter stalactiti]
MPTDSPDIALRTTALRKVFRRGSTDVVALDGVDLAVARGQVFGVLGTSGAGKSTLIRCLNGLERPTTGAVEVDGVDITALSRSALRAQRRRIGMVFQQFNLLNSRSALQNVALPLEIVGISRKQRRERALKLLDLVGLSDHADAHPAQLSGGQKQRVGIARALAAEPTVLLSDEATSALDEQTAGSVLDLLSDLNRRLGLTIVLVTHQLAVVKRMCDAAVLLREGRVVDGGTLADAAARPASPLGRLLLPALPDGGEHGAEVLDLVFVGEQARRVMARDDADDPLRARGVAVELLAAAYEPVGGEPVARLRVALRGPVEQRAADRAALTAAGAHPHEPETELELETA